MGPSLLKEDNPMINANAKNYQTFIEEELAAYDGIRIMAEGVAKNGVTSFLPTTLTVANSTLKA